MQLKRVFTLREKSTQGKRINIPRVASKIRVTLCLNLLGGRRGAKGRAKNLGINIYLAYFCG